MENSRAVRFALLMGAGALGVVGCGNDWLDDLSNGHGHHGHGGEAGGSGGGPADPPPVDRPVPTLVGPLSGSLASTAQPVFRIELADGLDAAAIDVCGDRACSQILVQFQLLAADRDNAGPLHGKAPSPLPAGVVFWRARGVLGGVAGTSTTPVWELVIPHRNIPVSAAVATRADVDGDGYTDFVLDGRVLRGGPAGYAGSIVIPPGPSNATLEATTVAGDLNGDGFTDLIRLDQTAEGNYALVGLWTPVPLFAGPSGFTAGTANVDGGSGALYSLGPAGDITGTGYADVVFKSRYSEQTWLGSLTGIFTGQPPYVFTSQAVLASDGDLDADGFSDVASSANGQPGFSVSRGTPMGLVPLVDVNLGESPRFDSIAMLDANGDGYSDVAVTMGDGVSIFAGPLSPGTTPTSFVTLGYSNSTALGAADFNADGAPDVVIDTGGALEVHYGHGGVPDVTPVELPTPGPFVASSARGSFGDVNGDGFDDLTVGLLMLDSTGQKYEVRSAMLYVGGSSGLDTTGVLFE
ncbi:MAG TPA: VCBS repeat-containing protein [Polyangia bacterium]|jgi:hypothetical protein|nr:VCBS repeat-containing protein [Polyangia bacterium]